MSTELVIPVWIDEDVKASETLLRLMKIFEDMKIEKGGWRGFTVRENNLSGKILQLQEPKSSDEIESILSEYNRKCLHFSIHSAFPCFRFRGMNPQEGFVPFWIEVWDQEFAGRVEWEPKIEGNATISFSSSGPFTALIEAEETPQVLHVNRCVSENLEKVTQLILTIAKRLKPLAMKAFTSQGLYQPLNAHLIFFREPSSLIDDLKLLKSLWDRGLIAYQTQPLYNSLYEPDLYAFHQWRGVEAASQLAVRLAEVVDKIDNLDSDSSITVNWQKYDNYQSDRGRVILDYPFWLNSFVDAFYLDMLNNLVDA